MTYLLNITAVWGLIMINLFIESITKLLAATTHHEVILFVGYKAKLKWKKPLFFRCVS